MMENAIYFSLKALLLTFLSCCPDSFGHVGKRLYKKALFIFKIHAIIGYIA